MKKEKVKVYIYTRCLLYTSAPGRGSAAEAEISAGKGVPERGTTLSADIVRLSASFGALEDAVRTQNAGGYS